jgi:nitrite reductase/ring-hydroxylating ferredoxin subunit
MGIFGRNPTPDSDGYYPTGVAAAAVTEGALVKAQVGRAPLLLSRVAEQIVACSRTCPHAAADLSAGSLARDRVTCPDHGWKFDLKSGRCLWPEDESARLKTYAVRVAAGQVLVKL